MLLIILPLLIQIIQSQKHSMGKLDDSAWKLINPIAGIPYYSCEFTSFIGGQGMQSLDTVAAISINIPNPHYKIRITLDYYYIDVDSDNPQDYALIQIDQQIFSRSYFSELKPLSNSCGDPLFKDDFKQFIIEVDHFTPQTTILVGANYRILKDNKIKSYWGFKNLLLEYFQCPALCKSYCLNDQVCLDYDQSYVYWSNIDIGVVSAEGWTTNEDAKQQNTQCGDFVIFGGGSGNFNYGSDIFKVINLLTHDMLRISFEIWSYNLDIDGIDFIIDDVVMDTIYMDGVNYFNLCPYSSFNGYNVGLAAEQPEDYVRFKAYQLREYQHIASSIKLQLKINNVRSDQISWGIRNFYIYTCPNCFLAFSPVCKENEYIADSVCTPCNYRCKSCTGPTKYDCYTCDSQLYRQPQPLIVNPGNQCICDDGYYDDFELQHALCQKCHYSCSKCRGPYYDDCIACPASSFRTLIGHIDDNNLSTSQNLCICNNGYYSQPANPICQTCNSPCINCFGPYYNNCLSCQNVNLVVSDGECVCPSNQYLYENTCHPCPDSCLTCTSYTLCTSCDSDRQLDEFSQCICNPYTYETNSGQCCHNSCDTCSGVGEYDCLTCSSNRYRQVESNKCLCNTGYYEDMNYVCQECHYSCLTCRNDSECDSCDYMNDHRIFISSRCECIQGYYNEDGNSVCQKCHYSCLNCNGSGRQDCTQCQPFQREHDELESGTGQCICTAQNYDDGVGSCLACHYSCLQCSGPAENECTECNLEFHKRENNNTNNCKCIDRYFDKSNTSPCQKCHQTCYTCSGPYLNNCLTCDPNHFRSYSPQFNTCQCEPRKFDNNTPSCQDCHPTCLKCSAQNYNNCIECSLSDFRILQSGQCICDLRKFDNGIDIVCQSCHYTCKTCSGQNNDQCLSCDLNKQRSLENNQCICESGYHSIDNQEECLKCHHKCETCSNAIDCLTCDPTTQRYLSENKCLCPNTLFDDGINKVCQECHPNCLTCRGYSDEDCLTCDEINKQLVLLNQRCVCQLRKFMDSNLTCQDCHYSCLNCHGPMYDQCNECDSNSLRVQIGTYCQCMYGTYDNLTQICAECNYKCKTCENQIECLSCDDINDNRYLVGKDCVCQEGTYEQESEKVCKRCHYSCLSCNGPDYNQCLSCDSQSQRVFEDNQCKCKGNSYEKIDEEVCQQCHYSCAQCNGPNQNNCLACDRNHHRNLFYKQCICSQGKVDVANQQICEDGLDETIQCNYQCQSCSADNPDICLTCNQTRELEGHHCVCIQDKIELINQPLCQDLIQCEDGYYYDNNNCYQCYFACRTCQGGSIADCTDTIINDIIYVPQIQYQMQSSYYRQTDIEMVINVELYKDQKQLNESKNNIFYIWNIFEQESKEQITSNEELECINQQFTIKILAYKLQQNKVYELKLLLWDQENPQNKLGPTYEWYIQESELQPQIIGGDRSISVHDELLLQGQIFDLDIQYEPIQDLTQYSYSWQCINVIYQTDCQDIQGNQIQFTPNKLVQTFPKQTFPYSSTYKFILTAKRVLDINSKQFSVYITFIIEKLIPIALKIDQQLMQRLVNLNEVIQIEFDYPQESQTQNFYSLNLYTENELKRSVEVHYKKFRLKLEDYLDNLKSQEVLIKGVLFNQEYPIPSTTQIKLLVNLPPRKCVLVVHPQQMRELEDDVEIKVQGCLDNEHPLKYKYGFYKSTDELEQDVFNSNQYNLNILSDYTSSPSYTTKFGCTPNSCDIILFVQVQDAIGGSSNYTSTITITKSDSLNVDSIMNQILSSNLDKQIQLIPQIVNRILGIQNNSTITSLKNQLLTLLLKARSLNKDKIKQLTISKQIALLCQESDIESDEKVVDIEMTSDIIQNLLRAKQKRQQQLNSLQVSQEIQRELYLATSLANEVDGKLSKRVINSTEDCQLLLNFTNNLSRLLIINAYPNEGIKRIQTSQFNISSSIMTLDVLENTLGPIIEYNKRVLEEDKEAEKQQQFYSYRVIQMKQNPYKSEDEFPYKEQNNKTVNPSLTKQENEDFNMTTEGQKVQIKQNVILEMDVDENKDQNQTCISQSNEDKWSNEECETQKRENKVNCNCKILQPTTIVDDVEGMFSKSVVTSDSFDNIARFKWWLTIIFYIICVLTIISIILAFYGYLLDLKQKDKIIPIHDKVNNYVKTQNQLLKQNQKKDSVIILQDDSPIQFQRQHRERKTQHALTVTSQNMQEKRQSTINLFRIVPDSKDIFRQVSKKDSDQNSVQNEVNFENIYNKENEISSKEQTERELKEKPVKQKKSFKQYFLENYQWTNVIFVFEKELGRPLRASLIYLTAIIELATTLYFGRQFTIQKILIVVGISAVATKILVTIFKKTIGSKNTCIKILGCFLYFATWGILIFISLAQVASQGSEKQANIWALQYTINFATENCVISVIELIIKYVISK